MTRAYRLIGTQQAREPLVLVASERKGRLTLLSKGGPACSAKVALGVVTTPLACRCWPRRVEPGLRKAMRGSANDIVIGVGGKQIIIDDPSGNPVELFEPTRLEARGLSSDSRAISRRGRGSARSAEPARCACLRRESR